MASIGFSLSNSKSIYVSIVGKVLIDGTEQKGAIDMATIVIGLVIAGYTGYLIVRQVRNVKAGNFCGSCSDCASAKSCGQ